MSEEIHLEPNWDALYEQFSREVKNTAEFNLFSGLPTTPTKLNVMREAESFLASISIALGSATTAAQIQRLRDLLANAVVVLRGRADGIDQDLGARRQRQ